MSVTENSFAIVGLGCRFPGGLASLDELWAALSEGCDKVGPLPPDRFDLKRFCHPDRRAPGRTVAPAAGIVGDLKGFDAAFFGMSVKEAEALDPQQRLILEMAWEAFEDAGIRPRDAAGTKTAVYIGAASTDMGTVHADDPEQVGPYSMTGTSLSIISNRVSYVFDLHGPSMTIDTACSSSLVALHEACRAMAEDHLPMALVGGVNVLLSPLPFVGFSKAHMLSEDGRCKVFDASGNGYVRSEGGAVLLIKPLEAALAAGDPIHAVIRATGVNSDGRTQGIALPNGEAQKALLESVYRRAGIDPKRVAYVEAHGTGTTVGDPIEAKSIGEVLGRPAFERKEPLWVGSVKSNLGHLETGSGMAGIAKAILVLEKGVIPPNIHFHTPNPAIPFEALGLAVPVRSEPLPEVGGLPLVAVNSFGFGGTNAHVVLEKAPASGPRGEAHLPPMLPLLLSAKSRESLAATAGRYAGALEGCTPEAFSRAAAEAAQTREDFPHRLLVAAPTVEAAVEELRTVAKTGDVPSGSVFSALEKASVTEGGTAFIFSGNGSQWAGMGAALLNDNPVFRKAVEAVDAIFVPLAGWSLAEAMRKPAPDWALEKTENAQTLLFAVQAGLCEVLRSHGILPGAVAGHSVGEVAAAWAAGALTLEDAVRVIFERSRLQGETAGSGTMAAVKLPEARLKALLSEFTGVEIAGYNAPDNFTVSGDPDQIAALGLKIKAERGLYKKLALNYAFHSSRMAAIEAPLREALSGIAPKKGSAGFYSTVAGGLLEGSRLDASYWWMNVREPVRFGEAVRAMMKAGVRRFVEIGPHAILTGYVRGIAKTEEAAVELSSLMRRGEGSAMLEAGWRKIAASGWPLQGVWPKVERTRRLPHYAWNRRELWPTDTAESWRVFAPEAAHPLLGRAVPHAKLTWESVLDTRAAPWLSGHVVDDTVLFPAAGILEMVRAAAECALETEGATEVLALSILRPLALSADAMKCVRTTVTDEGVVTIASRGHTVSEEWLTHVRARAVPVSGAALPAVDVKAWRAGAETLSPNELYTALRALGLAYAGAFKAIEGAWMRPERSDEVLVELRSRDLLADEGEGLSPALVDGLLQGIFFMLRRGGGAPAAYLPSWFGKMTVWRKGLPAWGVAKLLSASEHSACADFVLYDEKGEALAQLSDVRFRRARHAHAAVLPAPYAEVWTALPADRTSSVQILPISDLAPEAGRNPLSEWLPAAFAAENVRERDAWVPLEGLFAEGFLDKTERYARFLADQLVAAGAAEETEGLYRVTGGAALPSSAELLRTLAAENPSDWPDWMTANVVGASLRALIAEEKRFEDLLPRGKNPHALWSHRLKTTGSAGGLTAFVRALERLLEKRASGELRVAVGSRGATEPLHSIHRVLLERAPGFLMTVVAGEAHASRVAAELKGLEGVRTVSTAEGPFDLWIAPEGFSGAGSAAERVEAARGALLPGGVILALEPQPSNFEDFVEGADPRWWTEADGRLFGARLSHEDWERLLGTLGFDSFEVAAKDTAQTLLWTAQKKTDAVSGTLPAQDIPPGTTPGVFIRPDEGIRELACALQAAAGARGLGWKVYEDEDEFARAEDDLRVVLSGAPAGEDLRAAAPFGVQHLARKLIASEKSVSVHFVSLDPEGVAAKGLEGWLRVLRNEAPSVAAPLTEVVDTTPETVSALLGRLLEKDGPDEMRIVRGRRLTPTLLRTELPRRREKRPLRLGFDVPGKLDRLAWRPFDPVPLKAHEVRVAVRAAALNFRDVMWTMGLLPEEALENGFSGPTLGLEMSGVVTETGEGVSALRPGDEVVGFGPACFSTLVTTSDNAVAKKPASLTFEEAAAVPVTFFTVWYAVSYLARARKGERILIHGAAGGIGLAALQVAAALGLEVFATAGTDEKRAFLKSLGVGHVYNSRTLDFADEIRRDTAGAGVDIVLNSLAGAAAEKSLRLLAPFGRFLELGKRDFYADSPMFLRPFRRNLSYFGIDADQMMVDQPGLARELFGEVLERFESGEFRATPFLAYPMRETVAAFQAMQASTHIGKLVVRMDDDETLVPAEPLGFTLRREGTYVITGGFGGLGRTLARRFAREGAGALMLVSRRGAQTDEAKALLEELGALGVRVAAPAVDMTDPGAAEKLREAAKGLPPVAGVVHAAGVISDALIVNQTDDTLSRVWNTKVCGAAAVIEAFGASNPDFVVLFSSATVPLGNPGQSNYVAANAALEALAQKARGEGLSVFVTGWGPVGDVGMLEKNDAARGMLEQTLGTPPLRASEVVDAMEALVAGGVPVSHYVAVDWSRIRRMPGAGAARFGRLWLSVEASSKRQVSLAESLAGKSEAEGVAILVRFVTEEVASIMGMAPGDLNPLQPVSDIGMDSLMVVELSVALEERLGLKIPAVSLSGGATIRTIAERFWAMTRKGNEAERELDTMAAQHGVSLSSEVKERLLKEEK